MKAIPFLLIMLWLHVFDDFVLQRAGYLTVFKTKSYWCGKEKTKYDNDYIVCLIEHALSWAITISIPAIISCILHGYEIDCLIIVITIFINTMIHAFIDNEKANMKSINLITDQLIHLIQIVFTWIVYYHVLYL